MALPASHDITQLLKAWTAGDERALEKLTPLVYEQLLGAFSARVIRSAMGNVNCRSRSGFSRCRGLPLWCRRGTRSLWRIPIAASRRLRS